MPHVTARRLGALSSGVPPATPQLLEAYRTRVSEIAGIPAINPHEKQYSGLFSKHTGIDGTSVWAAATSGPDALPVQLLAYMPARVWDGPEAISVWVELVKERFSKLEKQCQNGTATPLGPLMASCQLISRANISEWDASVRAWLRAVDQAKPH